jgi:hypothetical protein
LSPPKICPAEAESILMTRKRGFNHSIRDGRKTCATCKVEKPVEEFYPIKHIGAGRFSPYCKDCKRAMKAADAGRFGWDMTPEDIARFWSHTESGENGCTVWKDYKNSHGYGQFYLNGRQLGAHRIAWKLAGHELPKWPNVLDHTCRNRACVEVPHMRAVPQRINTTENSECPHAKNAQKTHCTACNNPLSGANLAIKWARPKAKPAYLTRVCLTCYPGSWMYAVIERQPPKNSRRQWVGAQTRL